jgi:hypothetical protein
MNSTNSFKHITEIEHGDHLCCLYETDEELRAIIKPFLRKGLELGERVLYFVHACSFEVVLGFVRDEGVDIDPYLTSGQLKIIDVEEALISNSVLNPGGMITFLKDQTQQTLTEGCGALRVTVEMTWAMSELPALDRMNRGHFHQKRAIVKSG